MMIEDSSPEDSLEDAPESFLADPIETYLAPVFEDLALYEARARIPAALDLALGQRYTIDGELGHGGMGTVYLAFDNVFAKHVAVKVLSALLGSDLSAERFSREIEITAQLQHARIVPVHDRGAAQGFLYYVMPYFEDGSLRERITREGPLAIDSAIAIARDIASALDFAHSRGVVHRDVKPENILLERYNTAFLADFGVARLIDAAGRDNLTRTGIIVGTAQYMSPEQADPGLPLDGRADVYALACVVYEMLSGEPPFTGATQRDVLAKHLGATVPDLTVVRSSATVAMQRVLEIALSKSAVDRYTTAGDFVRALETAVRESDRPR